MADHALVQSDQGLARPVEIAAGRTSGRAGGPVQSDRLERAFRAEQLAGLKLATKMRVVALAAVAVMLFFIVPVPMVFYYEGLLAVFIVIGFVHYGLCRGPDAAAWLGYLFVGLDMALLSFTLVSPNPFGDDAFAQQMQLRNGLFMYFFLLVAAIAFTYSPRLMIWGPHLGPPDPADGGRRHQRNAPLVPRWPPHRLRLRPHWQLRRLHDGRRRRAGSPADAWRE